MEINGGKIIRNETNINAMGGSEIIATNLASRLDQNLLKEFQIVNSRVRELDESKVRIFIAHDLPGDPESEFLKNGGWDKFHILVFVSNWQMHQYMNYYKIPWSKCIVIQNAIEPLEFNQNKYKDKIKLAYWSTPHRGLGLLVPVFQKLCEKHENIELHVFSSFEIYGWKERDAQFESLFETCRNDQNIVYHGSVPNETIREALNDIHILAYPSIWLETSCMVLMEAMSAGLLCVHPNYGALYETAANLTFMYQWNENVNEHANQFYHLLDNAINIANEDWVKSNLATQSAYARNFYSWNARVPVWNGLLSSMVNLPRELPKPSFTYST